MSWMLQSLPVRDREEAKELGQKLVDLGTTIIIMTGPLMGIYLHYTTPTIICFLVHCATGYISHVSDNGKGFKDADNHYYTFGVCTICYNYSLGGRIQLLVYSTNIVLTSRLKIPVLQYGNGIPP